MSHPELPPTNHGHLTLPEGEALSGVHLALPASIRDWVPALSFWVGVDEHIHRLVSRTLGDGTVGDWDDFTTTALAAGLIEPGTSPGTYDVRPEWLPVLELELPRLGEPDGLKSRLLDAWLDDPDLHLAAVMAGWARDLQRWDAAELAWIRLNELGEPFPRDVLAIYRDLPTEARVERPLLSWAIGAATAVLADTGDPAMATVPHGMLLDAATLHANWSLRDDTDIAVQAGTLRMLGQRRQPSARAGESLQTAWRTKEELDVFIDARSREGRGPGRMTQGLFRAFSAQLALFRSDMLGAVNEARWAAMLTDREPVRVMARGTENLARSFSNSLEPRDVQLPVEPVTDPLGNRGMRGLGQMFEILAEGNAAQWRLDRERVERCLSLVTPAEAAFGGVWSVRTAMAAVDDAFWGDLTAGLERLRADVERQSRAGREQDEPLGGDILGRVRTLLLTKSGAFTFAAHSINHLPPTLKLLPQARIHLYAGQFEQAIRAADAGAYDGQSTIDRSMFTLLRAAAALLNGSADSTIKADAVREIRRVVAIQFLMPIATLPKTGRDALLQLSAPELGDEPNYQLMITRLDALNDSGEHGVRPLHLTERERVLLPLLASEDSVPEIARKLHVSVNTVRKQVVTLRVKFQAGTRSDLIRRARNHGALD